MIAISVPRLSIEQHLPGGSSVVLLQNSWYRGFSKFPEISSALDPAPNLENDRSIERLLPSLCCNRKTYFKCLILISFYVESILLIEFWSRYLPPI